MHPKAIKYNKTASITRLAEFFKTDQNYILLLHS